MISNFEINKVDIDGVSDDSILYFPLESLHWNGFDDGRRWLQYRRLVEWGGDIERNRRGEEKDIQLEG
jgi:hypothetical protein